MASQTFSFSNLFPGQKKDDNGIENRDCPANDDCITGIVFVVRRMAAVALHHYLQRLTSYDEELHFVRSDYVVGKRLSVSNCSQAFASKILVLLHALSQDRDCLCFQ